MAGPTFDGGELYRGLAAAHWDALDFTKPGRDFECFRRGVLEGNGPALEIGCGTGRILLPLLVEGLAVEGIDISEDMLACCRRRAACLGVSPTLYRQPMQRLSLDIRYDTLYVPCGTFVLVVDKGDALETLRRFRNCLRPRGSVLFNLLPPFDCPRVSLSDDPPWETHDDQHLNDSNGEGIVVHRRVISVDPVARLLTEQRRYRIYREGCVVKEEIRAGRETWYAPTEIRHMLSEAGFGRIHITGDYTGEAFSNSHHQVIVVQAWA